MQSHFDFMFLVVEVLLGISVVDLVLLFDCYFQLFDIVCFRVMISLAAFFTSLLLVPAELISFGIITLKQGFDFIYTRNIRSLHNLFPAFFSVFAFEPWITSAKLLAFVAVVSGIAVQVDV